MFGKLIVIIALVAGRWSLAATGTGPVRIRRAGSPAVRGNYRKTPEL